MNRKNDRLEILACDMESRYGPHDLVVRDIRSAKTVDDESPTPIEMGQFLRNHPAIPSRYGRLDIFASD